MNGGLIMVENEKMWGYKSHHFLVVMGYVQSWENKISGIIMVG